MSKWEDLEKKLLSDPAVLKEYQRLQPRYTLISQLIEARTKKGLTQQQLAKKLGTKQSAIARMESGSINISLALLERVVQALGSQLIIRVQ